MKAVLTRRRPKVRAFFAIVQLQSSRRFVFSSSAAAGQSIISSFTSDNHKLPLLQFENDWVDLKSEEWAEKKGMHSHSLSCCQSPHLTIIISSPNFSPTHLNFKRMSYIYIISSLCVTFKPPMSKDILSVYLNNLWDDIWSQWLGQRLLWCCELPLFIPFPYL